MQTIIVVLLVAAAIYWFIPKRTKYNCNGCGKQKCPVKGD